MLENRNHVLLFLYLPVDAQEIYVNKYENNNWSAAPLMAFK